MLAPQVHWPALQVSPAAQVMPQPPQLFGSLSVLAQPLEQQVSPAAQMVPLQAQAPLVQVSGAVQALPQAPQLALSSLVSAQVPAFGSQQTCGKVQLTPVEPHGQLLPLGEQPVAPQHSVPVAQAAPPPHWQTPPEQVSPGLQAWSHVPQWNGSLCRSTQPTPAQQVSLPLHAEPPAQRQTPPEQPSPVWPQAAPQLPQLATSPCRSEQVLLPQHMVLPSQYWMPPQR